MNILLLIDRLDMGGAETHVLTLAQALERQGDTVFVASDGGRLAEASSDLAHLHPPRPWSGRGFARSLIFGLLFLRRLHREHHFDVMHAHTRRTALLLRLFSVASRLFPRLFLSARAPFDASPAPYRKASLRRMDAPALVVTAHARFAPRHKRLSFWGEETIAVSEDLSRHLASSFGVDPAHITVVPNGVDTARFCPGKQSHRGDALHLVFASRLDGDCSQAAFMLVSLFEQLRSAAAKRGKRLHLTLVGGGSEYEALRRQVEAISVEGGRQDVRLTGALCDLSPVLQQADVFVGVSRAALEALLCGARVILGGNEGFSGVLAPQNFDDAANNNFCCRGEGRLTKEGLYKAFCSLLDQPYEQAERDNQALRRRLREAFGDEKMAKDTRSVYQRALSRKRRLRLLIAGYAGCGNLGDDAILRALIARWQSAPAPARLLPSHQALSGRGEEFSPRLSLAATVASPAASDFSGIPLVSRKCPVTLLRAIGRADALVLGGGCLLQNGSPRKNLSLGYYLALPLAARLTGCPVYLVASGLGPIRGALPRALTGAVLRVSGQVSVRDEASFAFAQALGVPAKRLLREPDPVLSIRPTDRCEIAPLLSDFPQAFVCVIPRPTKGDCHRALACSLKQLWQKDGIYPLFFAFDGKHDPAVCHELIRACGVGRMMEVRDEQLVAAIFGASRGVISQRLHGLILSRVGGAPALALAYDDKDLKLFSFAKEAGFPLLSTTAQKEEISRVLRSFLA